MSELITSTWDVFAVPHLIMEQAHLTASAKLVYIALCHFAGSELPKNPSIGLACSLSGTTVQRAMRELQQKGLLTCGKSDAGDYVFTIHVPPEPVEPAFEKWRPPLSYTGEDAAVAVMNLYREVTGGMTDLPLRTVYSWLDQFGFEQVREIMTQMSQNWPSVRVPASWIGRRLREHRRAKVRDET